MNTSITVRLGLVLYALGAIVTFGPATAQSEQARADYMPKCMATWAHDQERQRWCGVGGPHSSDGLFKAMAWPLWVSYTIASREGT